MPRKPKLLPYLQRLASGRLRYVRRVPPELKEYLGNRGYITVLMPDDARETTDKRLIKAWNEATSQVEEEIAAARAEHQAKLQAIEPVSALSPKDVAGIAAEPWRQLRNAVVDGGKPGALDEKVLQTVLITLNTLLDADKAGSAEAKAAARAEISDVLLKPILDGLAIEASEKLMQQLRLRYQGYLGMAEADAARLKEGDFQTSELESKPPPLPARRVSYQQLIDEWVRDAGGIREKDGVGVGQKQVEQYQSHIAELIEVTQLHYPAEVDIAAARQYLTHIQLSKLATATKQTRMVTVSNLFAIGVRVGLLDENPFVNLKIKRPKGARDGGYRPFTREELVAIFTEIKKQRPNERNILPLTLLMTGARLGDILFLRHQDIKQTKAGVWYFEMVDRPTDAYPRTLKGGADDERQTPMHPLLIERGFLDLIDTAREGYVFERRSNDTVSVWFRRLLQKTEIYEYRKTGLHSLRSTAIDAWRSARLPEDVRRALTAHSSKDVQEKAYGDGLQRMPSILFKELSRVDWSFLP